MKEIIHTNNAPNALGPYSQAVKIGNTVYLAGQIGIDVTTECLVSDDIRSQAIKMFANIAEVAEAAGGSLNTIVKLTIYLTKMSDFAIVNQVMQNLFQPPYPARTCVAVQELPKGACIEAEVILALPENK